MAQDILDSLKRDGVLSQSAQEKILKLLPENVTDKLTNIFKEYETLGTEERKEFLDELIGKFKQTLQDKVYDSMSWYTWLLYSSPYLVFIFALLFIVLVLVFFVYKLFKCLSDREMKREEKRKNKQMKKKK